MPGEQLHPPLPLDTDPTDWGAFKSKEGFELAELLYSSVQMSQGNIDSLFKICVGGQVPFSNHNELYAAIDEHPVGGVPWQSFSVKYTDVHSDNNDAPRPKWMSDVHEVFYRDPRLVVHEMLANPDFKDDMDFAPYRVFDQDGVRTYQHLMSGNWAWEQAVCFITSPSYQLNVSAHTSLDIGCYSSGPNDSWSDVRSHHSRKRQDDNVGSDRPFRSISTVFIDWKPS